MRTSTKQTWRIVLVLAIALPVALVIGIVSFVHITQKPLHTTPEALPSVIRRTPAAKWADAVELGRHVARAALIQQNIPGLSVAVGIRDEIVWAEGFGWADLKDRVPVAPEYRVRVGHASKALTSAAVGLLVEQGRLDLDAPIQKYVPAFPQKKWPVTLRQLMAHTAGITHYKDTEWGDRPKTHCTRASEGLPAFVNDPLLFEPGTEYRYSTYGWVLVSAAIEAVAGKPFFDFMASQVFAPLGMNATTTDTKDAMPDRVTPYFQGNFGLEFASEFDFSCFAGGAGFLSTPTDLVRFGQAMENDKLLRRSTIDMLQTPQTLTSGEETDYGLGWMLENLTLNGEPSRMVGHSARTISGATTSLMIFPGRGISIAVMANISFADTKSIALAIAQGFAMR